MHQKSHGRNSAGGFHSARLKIYPTQLNGIIAGAVVTLCDNIASARAAAGIPCLAPTLSPDLQVYCQYDVTAAAETVQPDFSHASCGA